MKNRINEAELELIEQIIKITSFYKDNQLDGIEKVLRLIIENSSFISSLKKQIKSKNI